MFCPLYTQYIYAVYLLNSSKCVFSHADRGKRTDSTCFTSFIHSLTRCFDFDRKWENSWTSYGDGLKQFLIGQLSSTSHKQLRNVFSLSAVYGNRTTALLQEPIRSSGYRCSKEVFNSLNCSSSDSHLISEQSV